MQSPGLDDVRRSVLDKMERGERTLKLSMFGAAVLEAVMFVTVLLIIDWNDRLHKLIFVLFLFTYFIVVLGLVALAGHVTRTVGRLLSAFDALGPAGPR